MQTQATFTTSLAERIATVAHCRSSGAWGRYTNLGFGRCGVDADGVRALISTSANGWLVAIVGGKPHFAAEDADLELAIGMALEAA